jgi:hypothetical protein
VSSGQAGAIGMALLKKYPVLSRACIFRQALSRCIPHLSFRTVRVRGSCPTGKSYLGEGIGAEFAAYDASTACPSATSRFTKPALQRGRFWGRHIAEQGRDRLAWLTYVLERVVSGQTKATNSHSCCPGPGRLSGSWPPSMPESRDGQTTLAFSPTCPSSPRRTGNRKQPVSPARC